jgi:hypothetical protein
MSTHDEFVALCEDMLTAWQTVPPPSSVPIGDATRATLSENLGAVEIIWGWTARVARLAEAALLLERYGFDTEIAPTIRSMVEHVIALPWVIDKRGAAYQALARQRSHSVEMFKKAQTARWTLSGEAAELLEKAINIETDDDTRSEDVNLATRHRAKAYGLDVAYQVWLLETWATHASFESATVYSEFDVAARTGKLSHYARPSGRMTAGAVAQALQAALTYYADFDENALAGRPAEWLSRMAEIMDQFKREHATNAALPDE